MFYTIDNLILCDDRKSSLLTMSQRVGVGESPILVNK